VKLSIRRRLAAGKRRIERRLDKRDVSGCERPMLRPANIQYELAERTQGMTYGGIAHGIGAALYEKFSYTDDGQLESGTFMDYLIPSAMEIPEIAIVDHCTPSPLTTFGQKGSGEAGYLGAPAAVANAINDALAPLGANIETLPITQDALWRVIQSAKSARN